MLLLNLIRVLIAVVGLVVFDALRVAYEIEGIAYIGVAGFVLFVVLFAAELAENALVSYFNPEEEDTNRGR